jgi:uncharacterized membrane protein
VELEIRLVVRDYRSIRSYARTGWLVVGICALQSNQSIDLYVQIPTEKNITVQSYTAQITANTGLKNKKLSGDGLVLQK